MDSKTFHREFGPRKFSFVKTFKLRLYIIFSIILIAGMLFYNFKYTEVISIFLLLFSMIFFIRSHHSGSVSYSSVLYRKQYIGKDKEYNIIKIPVRSLNFLDYIGYKVNQNVLICGTSGQGKSRLMRYLLYLSKEQKFIFSYKENDDYLKMGYNILQVENEMPDPFMDTEAFVNAFLITYPIQNMGIISQYIPIFLRDISKISKDWNDFLYNLNIKLKNSKDQIQRSAYLFIIEHSKALIGSHYKKNIDLADESIVFDFSQVNESSKTFYSELFLRILWKRLTKNSKKVLICIDEAHRLLYNFERYQSIYIEMSREIRAFGKLWTSTQNYSDMPSYVRNQFATQYIFNTSIKEDLDQLGVIDPKLKWAVPNMPKHCFTDARYPWIYKVVPEFIIFWYPLDRDKAKSVLSTVNYDTEVKKILRDNVFEIPTIVEIISKNYSIDENTVKINVKNSISTLIKNKEINRVLYDSTYMYFGKTLDSANLSLFHKFMENKVLEILSEYSIRGNVIIAKKGQNIPDISTEKFNIEIETGLKHDITDLKKRISSGDKSNIIVIPNKNLIKKYNKLKNVSIIEIKELKAFLEKYYT